MAAMFLRPKTSNSPKSQSGDTVFAVSDGPHAPSGSRDWQATASAEGSTTLWRRRGRIAPAPSVRRND